MTYDVPRSRSSRQQFVFQVTLVVILKKKLCLLVMLEYVNFTWQWTDGKVSYSTRQANKSWVHQKWSSSVVQLDQNTWILEYKQARSVENSRMVSAALEFLKFRLLREVRRMKQQFWLEDRYDGFTEDSFKVPTWEEVRSGSSKSHSLWEKQLTYFPIFWLVELCFVN